MPAEEFARRVAKLVEEVLVETGIYEVAGIEDARSVFPGSRPLTRWEWAKKDWELARRVGRELHADYAVTTTRSMHGGYVFWEMVFLNVATGKKYRSVSRAALQPHWGVQDYINMFKTNYRQIFQEAKSDMLATALQKSPLAPMVTPPQTAPGAEKKETPAPPPAPEMTRPKAPDGGEAPSAHPPSPKPSSSWITAPPAEERPLGPGPKEGTEAKGPPPAGIARQAAKEEPAPAAPREIVESPKDFAGVKILDGEKVLAAGAKPDGQNRLAVYDLETSEALKVVALILSEALREELVRLGIFALVNRENLVQVLKETELQMTGLVDEKQAVRVGKGLAANQIVMGRFGALGKTSVLQAKRVDVESQATLALESLKCSQGQEDELLAQMPGLARKLAGLP